LTTAAAAEPRDTVFGLVAFVRSAGVLGIGSFANLARAIVTAKVLAVALGPSLVGVLSQLLNFSALASSVVALGMTTGVVKLVADHRDDPRNLSAVAGTAGALSLASGLLTAIALVPFANQLSYLLTGSGRYGLLLWLIVASFPLYNLAGVLGYVLQGLSDIRGLTAANVLTAAAAVAVLVPATFALGLLGAILSVLVMSGVQALIFLVAVAANLRRRALSLRAWRWSPTFARALLGYGGVVLVGGIAIWLSLLVVRTLAIHAVGERGNGLYQVVYGLSNQYVTVFMTWMAAYVFPRVAAQRERAGLGVLLNSALRANLFIMVPVLVLTLALRPVLIQVFYSAAFLDAGPLFPLQVLGDFFRVLGWSFAISLFAQGHLRWHLVVVASQGAAWVGLTTLLLPALGLQAIVAAYAGSFALYPILGLALTGVLFDVRISAVNTILSTLGLGSLLIAAVAPPFLGVPAAVIVPAAVYWQRWRAASGPTPPPAPPAL